MEKSKKKVLFISSTGGHLSEMLRLSPMFKKYDYHIIERKLKEEREKSVVKINIQGLNVKQIFLQEAGLHEITKNDNKTTIKIKR